MSSLLQQLNAEMSDVLENVRNSLVEIHNGRRGIGAGIVRSPDGVIITNAHVVGRSHLQVTLPDGRTLSARVLAHDAEHDLAALAVDATGLPAIQVGQSQRPQPGQWVMALGHPWGVTGAVTSGVVIGAGSEWPEMPQSGREWVVVSLHLRPGYSGGPLVDAQGRLVGINTMMTGPDVGVAVPVHIVKDFVQRAKT